MLEIVVTYPKYVTVDISYVVKAFIVFINVIS